MSGRLMSAEARSQAEAASGGTLEGVLMNFSGKAYLTRASSPEHTTPLQAFIMNERI